MLRRGLSERRTLMMMMRGDRPFLLVLLWVWSVCVLVGGWWWYLLLLIDRVVRY